MDTAIVSMRVAYAKRPGSSSERLKVSISTDCGETWTTKKIFTSSSGLVSAESTDDPFTPANPDEWNLLVVGNIDPEERTENFRIQYEFRSNNGNNIYIDNINIAEELVTSTTDINRIKYGLNIYPNPVRIAESISLDLEMNEAVKGNIMLADVLGRNVLELWNGKFQTGKQTIALDIEDVPAGYYIVSIQSNGVNIATTPLVIE